MTGVALPLSPPYTMMKKIEQLLLLLSCLAVMATAAIQRDGKVWGHDLTVHTPEAGGTTDTVSTLRTLDDGTVVINTTALGRDIAGYSGNVPLEVSLRDGRVAGVRALPNTESPQFFARAAQLLDRWNGKTVEEAQTLKVDAVSGATYSSRAIIGNVHAALRHAALKGPDHRWTDDLDLSVKTVASLLVVLMAAIIPLIYRSQRYRTVQMVLNVTVLGLWSGTFLDWALLVRCAANGIQIATMLVPTLMLITALVYPLLGKRQYYCTHVCPLGSAQDLAAKAGKGYRLKLSARTVRRLDHLRQALFATLMVLMLTGTATAWMDYELFTAFVLQSASTVILLLALVMLALAVYVPRPYCRFVCPTGSLLKLI